MNRRYLELYVKRSLKLLREFQVFESFLTDRETPTKMLSHVSSEFCFLKRGVKWLL